MLSGATVTGHRRGFERLPSISCIAIKVDVCAHVHVCVEESAERGEASACISLASVKGFQLDMCLMERKIKRRYQLATARIPHMAATNYPSGFGQVISYSGPVLCLSEAPSRLRISGFCSKVHFLLPTACCSEILGSLPYDLTPCEFMRSLSFYISFG